jgi:hypothetical protein
MTKREPMNAKMSHFPALAFELMSMLRLRIVLKITNESKKVITPEKVIIV